MPKNKKCQFKSKLAEDYTCPELSLEESDYCIFHKPNKTEDEAQLFKQKIANKLQNKDYVFIGFYFPSTIDFASLLETYTTTKRPIFEKDVDFKGSTFERYADFKNSTFERNAAFEESTFRKVCFKDSIFPGSATFKHSTFEGDADFTGSVVQRDANFEDSTFEMDADFTGSVFHGGVDFAGSSFCGSAVFQDMTFKNHLLEEKIFRLVKNYYQRDGRYTLAGECYYKERIAKRKQLPWYSPKRWLEYLLLDGLCGYGERPLRAIRTGLGVVFGLVLLYWKVGHVYPSPELFKEPDHALTFLDTLYFSVVTFTTLGFGDWRPDPSHWIRYVVMSEAFIGAFLMALFIVTFARRMMR